jgi:hypothetical protein
LALPKSTPENWNKFIAAGVCGIIFKYLKNGLQRRNTEIMKNVSSFVAPSGYCGGKSIYL